jgi:hypothetical protein
MLRGARVFINIACVMVCGSFNEEIILKRYNYSLTHSKGGVKKKGKSRSKKI